MAYLPKMTKKQLEEQQKAKNQQFWTSLGLKSGASTEPPTLDETWDALQTDGKTSGPGGEAEPKIDETENKDNVASGSGGKAEPKIDVTQNEESNNIGASGSSGHMHPPEPTAPRSLLRSKTPKRRRSPSRSRVTFATPDQAFQPKVDKAA